MDTTNDFWTHNSMAGNPSSRTRAGVPATPSTAADLAAQVAASVAALGPDALSKVDALIEVNGRLL